MFKRKRDADEQGADISGSLSIKAVKYNPVPAPVQTSPVSEEDDSDPLKAVRRRPGGRLHSRIHHVRAPRGKKKGAIVGVAVAEDDVGEEDEEEPRVDEEDDVGEEDEEEPRVDEEDDDGDEEGKDPANDDESVDGNEEEGDGEDDEKEEQNYEDGKEERNDELIMPAHLGEPKGEDDTDEVTEEGLEHRLLGIGQQTKSVPPNQPPQSWPLSREREAALVAIHVQPFANPNTVGFATSTGAQKHTVPKGVSHDTAYTPSLERVFDNTGARKGAWSTGVDPDTEYAGDVMLFPTVDCVSKGIDRLHVLVLNCDEEETAPDAEPLMEADQPAASIEDEVVGLRPALSSSIHGTPARTFPARRKVVRLAFNSLKTSEEPTFSRGMKLPPTKHGAFGTVPSGQDEHATLPLTTESSSSESTAPTAPPNISLTLQAIMQGSGIPRGLHELELIVEGLADGMRLAPEPSYLDMRGGRKFDLDKEMARYSFPSHGRRLEPVDYTGRLLSLLNIQGC